MSSDRDATSVPVKKRRVQRACDECRKHKRACDGLRMSEKKCTQCIENGLECTFAGGATNRRSYVDALEARLEMAEQLLRKLTPQNENNERISNSTTPGNSQWSKGSPIRNHRGETLPPGPSDENPAVLLAIQTVNSPAPPSGDDLAHIALVKDLQDLSLDHVHEGFHGKSSGAMLVKAAVRLRQGYEEKPMPWSSRRMHYWTYNPLKHRIPHVGSFIFPAPDLLSELIDLYFAHKNIYLPVLHRPTFERSVADGLHIRDESFGAIVLLVCGIGARFSDDSRISPPPSEPLSCGWEFFDQLPLVVNHLFERPTLSHLQFYCLATIFLEFSVPSACWTFVGLGIRLAQDVGAHRAQSFGGRPTIESELWKRNFWVIVVMDRLLSAALGRSCAMHLEDFDAEMPLEVDDDYWENDDTALEFKQPEGVPSRITFFRCYVRLSNILSLAVQMLYALNKTKQLLSHRDPDWEEHTVAELDLALNDWVDSIPPHLRWDPNRRDEAFFDQSTHLYCAYYHVQMTIHRGFIFTIPDGASRALPSLAICTDAARSCTHVADIARHRRNTMPRPGLVSPLFTSALILLLNVWSGKRTGLPPQMNSAIVEVHKCMETIRLCEKRWQSAGLSWDLLYNLAAIGQLTLPKPMPQPTYAVPPNTRKRPRQDDTMYPDTAAPTVSYPLYTSSDTQPVQQKPTPLPMYTTDLGRLPIYHRQPGVDELSMFSPSTFNPGGSGLRANVDDMSNDMMAMWANPPTGFEIEHWGTYLTALHRGLNEEDVTL
ncbi:fungal-specific transcription factor domain-containing protein [Mycena alexandri]|uniref:Fungal-specific transcription factor domain-containing protein n=1 Tax=Mycena alexandri TaxID=1745969 RepID=A0AAD6SJC5_9AGAR|nr:fungal-specific transcription factor domain-containing protein [Mycena alexandri]